LTVDTSITTEVTHIYRSFKHSNRTTETYLLFISLLELIIHMVNPNLTPDTAGYW